MSVSLTERQTAILAGEMQPKFLASVSAAGEPNVVPVLSLCPCGPGTAGFAEFMLWKTKANLKETGRAAILALDAKLNYFTAHGQLTELVASGPLFDAMANQAMFRYNPYNGIRGAGSIELEAVDAEGRLPALAVLAAHLRAGRLARVAGGLTRREAMPAPVVEKFSRLKALKAVAWPRREGQRSCGVGVRPATGVAPVGRGGLVVADQAVAEAVPDGSRVAVAVITLDPVAYQVKGIARHWRGAILIDVTEAYTAGPPVPGQLCPAV